MKLRKCFVSFEWADCFLGESVWNVHAAPPSGQNHFIIALFLLMCTFAVAVRRGGAASSFWTHFVGLSYVLLLNVQSSCEINAERRQGGRTVFDRLGHRRLSLLGTRWLFNDSNFTLQLSGCDTRSLYPPALAVTVIALSGGLFSHAPSVSHLLTPVIDEDWPFVESREFGVHDELLSPRSSLIPRSFSLSRSPASV